MAGILFVLDPTSEDASNAQLDLSDATNYIVLSEPEPDLSPPDLDSQWASSSDTEGAALAATRHQNRRITLTVRVYGATANGLDSQIAKLQQKVGKITREGGTLKVTVPSGKAVVYDLLDAQVAIPVKRRLATNYIAEAALTFTAKPYGRGTPVQKTLKSETTLPVLVFTETAVGGDVPALGKLEVTDASGADQWWLVYGLQSATYDAAATAQLFYESTALTPLDVAASTTVTGASGTTAIGHLSLNTSYVAVLSTKISGGSHLSHVGTYRVFARLQVDTANNGNVSARLEWSEGDLRAPTLNDPVTLAPEVGGKWFLADLGTVHLARAARGTQQWEGRVLAKTTSANDNVYVDYLLLVPTECSGEASATPPTATPTIFHARDEFNQTAGALTGKTASVGGTWNAGGNANDFSVVTSTHTANRTAVSDAAAIPRRVYLSNVALTDQVVQVDFMAATMPSGGLWTPGLILRHDTTSGRHLRVAAQSFNGVIAYDFFTNDTLSASGLITANVGEFTAGQWYTLRALADQRGRLFVWFGQRDNALSLVLHADDSRLATGGSWASGAAYGFYDHKLDSNAQTRSFNNFWAAPAERDAAIFASQSAEVRYDQIIRENATGTIWTPASIFEGDLLKVPPAGQEARTLRVLVKTCRNDPTLMSDPAIDDLNAQLTVIERFLELPE